jgi:hypothetical protein
MGWNPRGQQPAGSSYRARDGDALYGLRADLDFIKVQLARLPTRNDVWRAALMGMLGGAVAAVTLIEAFARSCL